MPIAPRTQHGAASIAGADADSSAEDLLAKLLCERPSDAVRAAFRAH